MTEFSDMRISDVERESALTALGAHMGTGRLDVNEFSDRSARLAAATTRGDLTALFKDLPEPHPVFDPTEPPKAAPAPVADAQTVRRELRPDRLRVLGRTLPVVLGAAVVVLVISHLWLLIAIPVVLGIVGAAVVRAGRGPRRSGWNDGDLDGDADAYYDSERYGWYGRGYTRDYTRSYLRRYRRGARPDRDDDY